MTLQLLSVPVGALGALFALLTWGASGCQSYSTPLYSPNGKMAARIRTADEGALGGGTSVELFSAHGLDTNQLFQGGWRSVQPGDVRWTSDSELTISYEGEAYSCASAQTVKVRCTAKR